LTDAYPTIAILSPGANIDVAGDEQLPLLFRLTDDYGISQLRLAYKLVHSRYEPPAADFTYVNIPPTGTGPDRIVPSTWNLGPLRLTPEDVIEYHAEVFDNDNVSGPKKAVSESYTLRLPSIDEVFADVDKGHEESRETLTDALKQAEEAKKQLDELARDLKKPQERLSWEDKKKAEDVAKRYEEVQKKLEQAQQTMDRMMQEMQKNNTVSRETLEKYQELQHMMEQMNSPEFAEAMKKMQDAMQQMTPEAMKQAMQQFAFSEDQFRKSIERTLNLLKRIQIEQKMDEAVKRAEAMKKAQDDVQKQTAEQKADSGKTAEETAKRQEDLARQYEKMREELKELQKKMEEFPAEMPLEQMQKMQQELDRNNLEQLLQQSAQSLRQQKMQDAMSQQQQASQKMGQMAQDLRDMQQQMSQNQQKQIVNEMRRAAKDLLELSRREESLKNSSRGLDPGSQQFRENAQQQMEVLNDLGNVTSRIAGLSQKTFSISPEMGKSIGEAMRQMKDAMQSLDQRNGAGASQQQGGAMGSLNETAQQLQSAAQGMSQGGGQGMGMAGFMQRLQQMGGQQQGINEGTKGLTPQQAAEMGRLAAEQGAVRKSLEDLAREASRSGELSKLLGDLQRVARDMREVQTDLAGGNVNPETMNKQERILSRLLDAQRSMHERDFEKRRKAETGTNTSRQSPPPIDLTTVEGRNRLQRDLLRALEEGYARDYEELIKKYFEALQQ
jgi:DNA repair exonuclease SbcCD ATPase subunit